MPETRIIEVYKGGTVTPELDHTETYTVSDEKLADEAEAKAVRDLIDGLASTDKLKKIGLYLRKKGYLP